MYAARFNYLFALLALVAAAAIAAVLLGPVALGEPVRTETQYRDAKALTNGSSAQEARGRFTGAPQSIDGTQLGFPDGITCDAYQLKDGVALICHA